MEADPGAQRCGPAWTRSSSGGAAAATCRPDTASISLKCYEQGREKWQGETLHCVWFDEEPPLDIYSEGLTRTNVTPGLVYLTFTPLLGMSERCRASSRTSHPIGTSPMTIDDA